MSSRYLLLKATWLTDEYHGEEWPPSPARAYQALMAGLMTGANRALLGDPAEQALRWLARQPAPRIFARFKSRRDMYRIAVPNNDLDKVARVWAKGGDMDVSKFKTLKEINANFLNPDQSPHVIYCWPLDAEGQSHHQALRDLSHRLHTLGWGRDMAYADVELADTIPPLQGEIFEPVPDGDTQLGVPLPGFFDDLIATHARFLTRATSSGVNTDARPSEYTLERYKIAGLVGRPMALFNLVPLDPESRRPFSWPLWKSQDVAAWLRHAANEAILKHPALEGAAGIVSGHVSGDRNQRLSYVPIPSIGHSKSDGRIRRAAILAPVGSSNEDMHNLLEFLQRALIVSPLVDIDGNEVCRLEPMPRDEVIWNTHYHAQSRRWHSVTPVILHGYNSLRGNINLKKTYALIGQAFEESGFPKELIDEFSFQPAPFVPNTPAAAEAKKPQHLRKWPAYHIAVRFRSTIQGPLSIGIGRHYGFGLFTNSEA